MKKFLLRSSIVLALILASSAIVHAATGTIDPSNVGNFKAQIQNTSLGANTNVNFGKFSTQSASNITVSDTELRGYAWGDGVGWIVTNCKDAPSNCTNSNFKVSNDGNGNLSGYAWGQNTGWVNFGPFTNSTISTVQIGSDGKFGGTLGHAGYAWAQNYGWILFDCTVTDACVETDWRKTRTGGGGGGGTTPPATQCNDRIDNDGDGLIDYPADPGCVSAVDINESNDKDYCPLIIGPQNNPNDCIPIIPPITPPGNPPVVPPTQPPVVPPTNPPVTPPTISPTIPGAPYNPTTPHSIGGNSSIPSFQPLFQTSGFSIGAKIMSGLGIAAAALAPLIATLFLNPLSLYDIFLLLGRLWTLLLVAFGLKKRTPPWGVVYDSVTKQPLDPAYVVLTDMEGNEIATSITDIDGRYGFLVGPGVYKLMANKSNYNFPSVKLAGKNSDELYGDLYFGETIEVTKEGGIIAKNIPLDQINFDWNEFAKKERALTSFYHHRDVVIGRIADVLFVGGFIFSIIAVVVSTTTYNICIIALYILIAILKRIGIRAKPKGEVYEGYTRDPLPFSIVRVLSTATGVEVAHRVSNRMGKYYCLISNGEYKIVVDKKNPDGTYTKVPIEQPITVDKGYIKKDFRL